MFDPNLHGASQDAVESVLRPQEPTGIVGTGRADFGAHYVDGALDLDSHAGFESVHTLFSPAPTCVFAWASSGCLKRPTVADLHAGLGQVAGAKRTEFSFRIWGR